MSTDNSDRHSLSQAFNVGGNFEVSGQNNYVDASLKQYIQEIHEEYKLITPESVITNFNPDKIESPYKALESFDVYDDELFQGRTLLIRELLQACKSSNLILVLGASGSGKSSVVRAGLIPKFLKQDRANRHYFLFTPGQNPFKNLKNSLEGRRKALQLDKLDFGDVEAKIEFVLEETNNTFKRIQQELIFPGTQWLVFIDQFEQLFTDCQDLSCRKNFIDSITEIAQSEDSSLTLILAMRADFLEQFTAYPQFGRIAQKNIHLVTEMYPEELEMTIKWPAAQRGVVFQTGLVPLIISQLQGKIGTLPLLQYTLHLLWKYECEPDDNGILRIYDRTLNIDSYNALQGVQGALQKHVEAVYAEKLKTLAQQEAAKQVFLQLGQWIPGEGGQYISVSWRRLRSAFKTEIETETLQVFIKERLIVSSTNNLSQEALQDNFATAQQATVEIAHEILISAWERLKGWIEEAKDVLTAKSQLQADMARYAVVLKENEIKANDELLMGSRLERILELWDDGMFELRNISLEVDEIKFIEQSVEWRDRQIHEKEEQIQKLNQAITEATLRAQSSRVKDIINSNPLNGIVHAIQEVGINLSKLPDIVIDSVQSNLLDAIEFSREANSLQTTRDTLLGSEVKIIAVAISPESYVNSINMGGNGTSRKIISWNISDDYPQEELQIHQDVDVKIPPAGPYHSLAAISQDTMTVVSAVDNNIYVYDRQGSLITPVFPHKDNFFAFVSSVSINSNGNKLLSVSAYSACLWDREGNLIKELHTHNNDENLQRISSGAISNSGKLVALGYESGSLIFLDGQLNPLDPPFKAHEHSVHKIEISQNEEIIVSGGSSDQVKLWNRKGEPLGEPLGFVGHHDVIVSISPDNKYIAASSLYEDKIYLWDREILDINGNPILKILKGSGASSLNFSSSSEILVSGNLDGEIKLWDVRSEILARLPKTRSAIHDEISISFDGKYIGQKQNSRAYGIEPGHVWNLHGNLVGQNLQELTPLLKDSILGWSKTNSITNTNNNEQYCLVYGSGFWTWWFAKFQSKLRGHKISPPLFGNEDEIDWSAGSERRRSLFFFMDSDLSLVAISLDQQTIVSLTVKGLVQLWDKQLNIIDEFSVDCNEKLTAIAISHDGQVIATSSKDKTVKLWDRNGNLIAPPLQHEYPVISVTFSTSGESIISHSQSDDNVSQSELQLWNRQGQSLGQILRLKYDGNPTLAVSPDHSYIVTDNGVITSSSTRQGELRLWRVGQIMDWLQIACNRLKNHPILKNPKSQQALSAREVCRKYVWYPKAEELTRQGLQKIKTKEYQEAIQLFTESISYNSEYIKAYYYRGRSYALLQEFENASKDFSQAIDLRKSQCQILNTFLYHAVRFQSQKRRRHTFDSFSNLAEDFLTTICFLQSNPNLVDVYFYRGWSHSQLRDLQQAKTDWQAADKLYEMQMANSTNAKKVKEFLNHPAIKNLGES